MTSLYMLDTDTCAFILRRSSQELLDRIQSVPLEYQCISIVTLAELMFGVHLSSKKKANQTAVEALVRHVEVLDWTRAAAEHYAEVRADLNKRGRLIGANDLLIGAHARSLGAILVSHNVKEFGRIKGLSVEDWMTRPKKA